MPNRKVIVMLGFIIIELFCFSNIKADIVFDDGLTHDITWTINDKVCVYNSFPENNPTKVNIFGGGRIETLYVHGDGNVWVNNGSLNYLQPVDESTVEISSGTIDETIWAGGNCTVTVHDAQIGQNLLGNDECEITFWGGSIYGNFGLSNWCRGFLYGGSVDGELIVNQDCQLTIAGSDFIIDGSPVDYGTYTTGGRAYVETAISGILLDGSTVNNTLIMTQDASVVLTPIPEPCTLFLLFLGGLALPIRRRSR